MASSPCCDPRASTFNGEVLEAEVFVLLAHSTTYTQPIVNTYLTPGFNNGYMNERINE